jgi:hypothetical protein
MVHANFGLSVLAFCLPVVGWGGHNNGMEMQKITMGGEPLQQGNEKAGKSHARLP